MYEDTTRGLLARFGRAGLRRIDSTGTSTPGGEASMLGECGVPRAVGPYFTSPAGDPVLLGAYRGRAGAQDERSLWCRLGTDRGAELCVDDAGAVRADFGPDSPATTVNGTLRAFLDSLTALDAALAAAVVDGDDTREAPGATDAGDILLAQLRSIDPRAVSSEESWWSRIVEDIRHTTAHTAYAAFEFLDAQGEHRIVSGHGGVALHPEERMWSDLRATGVAPGRVGKVYTELEPCYLPGHYCAFRLAAEFPDAEFTHSFDYGETAASREAGMTALLRHSASL